MSNELALTAADMKANVQLIQEVMKAVMKGPSKENPEGVHYGKIPGCGDKLTLYKAGSEVILSTFRIAVEPVVEDLSTDDCARYRVSAKGIHQTSSIFLGAGIGEASSDEEKYKWKKAVCDEEWNETPENRRREKWFKGYQGSKPYKVKQIRTNPSDVANTVLKMAKKRSQIDMTLTVTAASDIFTQDLEDEGAVPDTGAPDKTSKPTTSAPQEVKGEPAKPVAGCITPKQAGVFYSTHSKAGKTKEDVEMFLNSIGASCAIEIKLTDFDAALKWASEPKADNTPEFGK